ncbi:MAG: Mu-like prophage FluMu protein gp29 [Magnetococcales bacterium]|nr:Mu-like prophage FluMu protein gp29 [Magnetococcales bacterium]
MALLDHTGRPITLPKERQTETTNNHWLRALPSHPARKITPDKIRTVLDRAENGDISDQCDLMEDMEEMDAHLHAELSKRRRALLTLPWTIEPPRGASAKEKKNAVAVAEWVRAIPDFEDVILDLADAVGKGFSCLELDWKKYFDGWRIQKIHHRPQRWFQFGLGDGIPSNEIRLRSNSVSGDELWPFGWIVHTHRSRSGWAVRGGLMRTLAWPFLFKYYAVNDFAEFLQIFGLPLRLGKFPSSATREEQTALARAVKDIGRAAAGIIPESTAIEFEESARIGGDNMWLAMMDWAERSISKAVLGGTLTSQADGKTSTNALGQVHDDVRRDLLESDARQIASTLTRSLVWPLAALNIGIADPLSAPVFRFDMRQSEDLQKFADSIPNLVAVGMQIPTYWVHEKLGIPEPKDGEPVLQTGGNQSAATVHGKVEACPHCASLSVSGGQSQSDLADQYTDQGMAQANSAVGTMLEPVRALLTRASSLEEFRDSLFAVFPDMDSTGLATILAQAMTAAHLGGRAEVIDGD